MESSDSNIVKEIVEIITRNSMASPSRAYISNRIVHATDNFDKILYSIALDLNNGYIYQRMITFHVQRKDNERKVAARQR